MPKVRSVPKPSMPPPYYTAPTLPKNATEDVHPDRVRRTAKRAERRDIMAKGPEGKELLLWGEQYTAGKLQYSFWKRQQPSVLWLVIELQAGADALGGECDGFIECLLADGKAWPASKVQTWWYPGMAAGELCTALAAVDPTWDETFPGTCYGVLKLVGWGTYWKDVPNVIWRYRAKKCLKPDTLTFQWTKSSWDQFYSYMRFSRGKGLTAAEIDTAAFAAAKAADVAAGRVYESHLSVLGDEAEPEDVIDLCRLLTDSWCFPNDAGVYTVIADRAGAATTTITESHVSAGVPSESGHPSDVRERPNKVTIWHTDVANGRQLVPRTVMTQALRDGFEKEVPIEMKVPSLYDPAVVDRRLAYQLLSRQFDLRVKERWNVKAEDVPLGSIVDRVLAKRGDRHFVSRLLRRTKNPNNTSDVELLQHDNAKFSATVVAVTPKVPSSRPDLREAPPNIDPASITCLPQLFKDAAGNWLPQLLLTYTLPADFAYVDCVEVWLSVNGGAQHWWFDAPRSPATTPALTEPGTYTLTLKVRHSITDEVSSGTVIDVPVAGATGTPADVVDVVHSVDSVYWGWPQIRSTTRYGGGSWTNGTNAVTGLLPASVNDGNFAVTCFTTTATSPGFEKWVRLDSGAGGKRMRQLDVWTVGALSGTLSVEHSADGVGWATTTLSTAKASIAVGGGVFQTTISWSDPGSARRYWRPLFSGANTVREVHFSEYLGDDPQIAAFQVFNLLAGATEAFGAPIPAIAIPTVATPLDLKPIRSNSSATWNTSGGVTSWIRIVAIRPDGSPSAGVASFKSISFDALGGASPSIPQTGTAITCVNGANGLIQLPGGPGHIVLQGPTAPYSIAGFNGGSFPGVTFPLTNQSANPLSLLDNAAVAAGGAATAGIDTSVAATLIVHPYSTVWITYNGTASRFCVHATAPLAGNLRRLFVQVVDEATTGIGERDLLNNAGGGVSIPAGTLALNNDGIDFEAAGAWAASGSAKTVRVRLTEGANNRVVFDSNGLVTLDALGGAWNLRGRVWRTSSSTFESTAVLTISAPPSSGGANVACTLIATGTVTWGNAVLFRITASGSFANDVTMKTAEGWLRR